MNVHAMRRILAQDIEARETEALAAREAMKTAPTEIALISAETAYEEALDALGAAIILFERTAPR